MNKIIIISILTLAMLLSLPASTDASLKPRKTVVIAMHNSDLRTEALRVVFEKYNSPLEPNAKSYIDYADKYGIDWKLLPAIAGLESSFGNAQLPGSFNSYGWGGGHIYFKSVEDGIDTVLFGLKNRYMSRGATTVETIAPIYSESPTWAPRVRRFMNEIELAYEKLGMNHLSLTI